MFSVAELARHLGAELVGAGDAQVVGLGSIGDAGPDRLTHLSSRAYRHHLAGTRAAAVLVRRGDVADCPVPALIVDDPYLAFAQASRLFAPAADGPAGVSPHAIVAPDAQVAADATIGPFVLIGAAARIESGARIGSGANIGARCVVGAGSVVHPRAVLYPDVRIGERCIIHSGAILGADGFGFAPDRRGHLHKIEQLGGVSIGNDVEVGASTTIDRGAINDTRIDDGVKIDNQVQIGHNCIIGAHSVICGCVGIVGSTVIGRHCILGGGVGVGGDGPIAICDGVTVTGMTHVSSSITRAGTYSSGTLHAPTRQWKRAALHVRDLHQWVVRLRRLERQSPTDAADGGAGGVAGAPSRRAGLLDAD